MNLRRELWKTRFALVRIIKAIIKSFLYVFVVLSFKIYDRWIRRSDLVMSGLWLGKKHRILDLPKKIIIAEKRGLV